jgi:hypothetical protein
MNWAISTGALPSFLLSKVIRCHSCIRTILIAKPLAFTCISCCNPNLGLPTKARGCKVVGQEKDLRVTSHVPRIAKSVREWTLTLPSELPCWELESQMDFRIFKAQLQGSKLIALQSSLYHWKAIEAEMSKMGSHSPFGHLKHKLWPKKRPGVKLGVWLPTIKS